jgi:creatinine amidohydrolase
MPLCERLDKIEPTAQRNRFMKFHEMTWPLLRQVPRDKVVIVAPIAACEQHSRHMPVYTDTILVTGVAEGVELKLPQKVLLLPTLWFGASHHHLPFGATLSASVDLHIDMLTELLIPLLDDGYLRFLVLNGHGGNIDTMQVALRRLQPLYRDRLMTAASYWDLAKDELAALAEGPRKQMGHACEFETSMIMALRPELVRRDELKNDDTRYKDDALRGLYVSEDMSQCTQQGSVGYSELATPEKGKKFLGAAIDRTSAVIEALMRRPLPETRIVVDAKPTKEAHAKTKRGK